MSDVVAGRERLDINIPLALGEGAKESAAAPTYYSDEWQDPSTVNFAPEHTVRSYRSVLRF